MFVKPRRIFRRLSSLLRSNTDSSEPSLGKTKLADGTVLERCVWMTREEIHQATASQGQPQLFIHWRSDAPDCIEDLPYLREVHLFWAHHVDYIAICWDRVQEKPSAPAEVAEAVDAWHRDYGLTWDSLIYDGQAGPLDQVHCIAEEALPQVVLVDTRGEVVFRRSGPFAPDEHIELRQLLRSVCSQ